MGRYNQTHIRLFRTVTRRRTVVNAAAAPATVTPSFDSMTRAQLWAIARERGLGRYGSRAEIIEALNA